MSISNLPLKGDGYPTMLGGLILTNIQAILFPITGISTINLLISK